MLCPGTTTPSRFRPRLQYFSTRHQWFTFVHLSVTYLIRSLPDLFLLRSRPWLLTTAARGDLEPAPVSRLRGACPHQSCSCAMTVPSVRLYSRHTVVAILAYDDLRQKSGRRNAALLHARRQCRNQGSRFRVPRRTYLRRTNRRRRNRPGS